MTNTINHPYIANAIAQTLRSEGFSIQAQYKGSVIRIQTDSLIYAEGLIEELQLQVGNRIDNTFDGHILYTDYHNKAVAKYNYNEGFLLISIPRNYYELVTYVQQVNHVGFDIMDNPLAVLHLLNKIKA